jgi:WhiB family redox-sensing transcriptional regulator
MTKWEHMAALIGAIPDLQGARCVNHVELFDNAIARRRDAAGKLAPKSEVDAARSAALRVCESCPALARCEAWLEGVRPYRRPRGVVAGQVVKLP